MNYSHAISPLKLRSMELKNRIVRTAHGTTIGAQEPGSIGPKFIAYHQSRAEGGVALILLEVCSVHPSCHGPMRSYEPGIADGYRRLVDAIAPTGTKIMQQLWHGGVNGRPLDGGPPWAPSPITSPLVGMPAVPMTKMMIDDIVEAYARGAKIALDAGVDGIEIHGGHSYLIQQFLSPVVNQREDDYGGSLENRLRFPLEVLKAVRSELGEERPMSMRLSADSRIISAEECQRVRAQIEESGLLDLINYSKGSYYDLSNLHATMCEPTGYMLPTAEIIGKDSKLPRLVTGRFRTLEEADQLIRQGQADLVNMVRATIADPELVNKSVAGREQDVRPCIACNQACVANVMRGGLTGIMPMSCAVNPTTGLETVMRDDVIEPASKSKRVLVIGGGPAGMEAARIAALKGHKVTLAEASPNLGGQILLAKQAPFRHTIGDIIDWQERQLRESGVEIKLNTYFDTEDVLAESADAVVVATGSTPNMEGFNLLNPSKPILGADLAHVVSSHDIYASNLSTTGAVVISDDVGHYEGIAVAETLLERGASEIIFVTRLNSFAPQMEFTTAAEPAKIRLHGTGKFRVIPNCSITQISDKTVTLGTAYGTVEETVDAALVALITFNHSNNAIFAELQDRHDEVHIVGDANSARFLETAIREANFAARKI